MPAFTIDGLLRKILGDFGVTGLTEKVLAELKMIKSLYPDTATQIDKLTMFLVSELTPVLDPTIMFNTLRGVAMDIISGTTGVNDDAWMTSV